MILAASRSGYRTLRRETYSTLFALLASTGLRVSEAIRLQVDDLTADGLVVRCSKFRKSRLVGSKLYSLNSSSQLSNATLTSTLPDACVQG